MTEEARKPRPITASRQQPVSNAAVPAERGNAIAKASLSHRHTALGIMTKYWTPGHVKTRLAEAIGMDAAAEIHRLFCGHLCDSLNGFAGPKQLVVSPKEKRTEFEEWVRSSELNWGVSSQSEGDLGDRMYHWFNRTLSLTDDGQPRNQAAILIGSDCPTLTPHGIVRAIEHLRRHDLVLGPALDGGYYLIGMTAEVIPRASALFGNIPWSTDQVLACTLRTAERSGFSIGLLQPQSDIDTHDDLIDLQDKLGQSTHQPFQSLLAALTAALNSSRPTPNGDPLT